VNNALKLSFQLHLIFYFSTKSLTDIFKFYLFSMNSKFDDEKDPFMESGNKVSIHITVMSITRLLWILTRIYFEGYQFQSLFCRCQNRRNEFWSYGNFVSVDSVFFKDEVYYLPINHQNLFYLNRSSIDLSDKFP
jgi:hypothetical protein